MAFDSSVTERTIAGTKRIHFGTYTNASGDTGGDIDTGLSICDSLLLQAVATAGSATTPVVNETLPASGSAVTVITADGEDGNWIAFGI